MMEALMLLCQEKHIDQLYLLDRLEAALAETYAKVLKLDWGAKVTIDRATGKIYVYRLEPIDDSMDEEGNFTEFEEIDVTPKDVSRLAAQTAKAEINAIVRNAAREQILRRILRPRRRPHQRHRVAVHARLHHRQDSRWR